MNEKTNRTIEEQLKQNRHIRYDEIDRIMVTVDKLTDWKDQKKKEGKEEPPLKAMLMATFNTPVWAITLITILAFIIGRYVG